MQNIPYKTRQNKNQQDQTSNQLLRPRTNTYTSEHQKKTSNTKQTHLKKEGLDMFQSVSFQTLLQLFPLQKLNTYTHKKIE